MPTAQIDDSDPQVQYSSGWRQSNSLPGASEGLVHGSTSPGSTATLTFSGTGVEVHGIVQNTNQHPTMKFTVDRGSQSTYTAPTVGNQNAMVFFQKYNLSPGQHTLDITNQDGDGSVALWLDFFVITSPSTQGNPPPASTQRDPPTDPSRSPDPPKLSSISTPATQHNPAPTTSPSDSLSTTPAITSASNASSTRSLPVSISESSSGSDSGSATASLSGPTTAPSASSQSTISLLSGSSTFDSPLSDNAASTTSNLFASSTSTPGSDPLHPAVTDTAHAASHPNVSMIVGIVVSVLVLLTLLVVALLLYRRRLKKKRDRTFIYPFMGDQTHNRDDKSEVDTVATTAEGILATWVPEMFQVSSRSTVNLTPSMQPPLPQSAPIDAPFDGPMYTPSINSASYLNPSKPGVHQSMGSIDVDGVQGPDPSPRFDNLSPVGSRSSWPAL